MYSYKRFLSVSATSAVLLAGALLPIAASASSGEGTLKVYVDVNDRYSDSSYDSPSDFTVRVYGDDVSDDSFRGSSSGTTVKVDGWYSVSIPTTHGYTPSYSSGCSGDLDRGDTRTCRITLDSSYNRYDYDYPYYSGQTYPYYQQPCGNCQQPVYQTCGTCGQTVYQQNCGCAQPAIVSTYIPALPNTGFEPVNTALLALVLAVVAVAGLFAFPYVRKSLATVLR